MTTPTTPPNQPSNFVIAESGTTLAWLLHIDGILTRGMGGLFSERDGDLTGIKRILDIGCGPGGWALEVGRVYPEVEVIGIDVSKPVVDYARAHAQARGFENVHFRVMNALEPLAFADESFDLVNARTIMGFMTRESWPRLIKECQRITRPGGILRLTEFDISITSSAACGQLWSYYTQALHTTGRTFSADGRHIGVIHQLPHLLRAGGYQQVQHRLHGVDNSAGSDDFEGWYQNYTMVFELLKPFCVGTGVVTREVYEQQQQQLVADMSSPDFRAIMPFLTTWGEKASS